MEIASGPLGLSTPICSLRTCLADSGGIARARAQHEWICNPNSSRPHWDYRKLARGANYLAEWWEADLAVHGTEEDPTASETVLLAWTATKIGRSCKP